MGNSWALGASSQIAREQLSLFTKALLYAHSSHFNCVTQFTDQNIRIKWLGDVALRTARVLPQCRLRDCAGAKQDERELIKRAYPLAEFTFA